MDQPPPTSTTEPLLGTRTLDVLRYLDGTRPKGRRRWQAVVAVSQLVGELAQQAERQAYRPSGRGRVPRELLINGLKTVAAGGVTQAAPWLLAALVRLNKSWAEGN